MKMVTFSIKADTVCPKIYTVSYYNKILCIMGQEFLDKQYHKNIQTDSDDKITRWKTCNNNNIKKINFLRKFFTLIIKMLYIFQYI